MKSFLHSPFFLTLISLLFLHTSPLFGQAAAPVKVHKTPFNGHIVALDTSAQTITLNGKEGRVLHLASTTKVIDATGNPTTFSTAAVGDKVSGSYIKDEAGTMTLSSLRIGAKVASKTPVAATPATETGAAAAPPAAPAPATAATPPAATAASDAATATKPAAVKKTRFSGKVTAVDAAAGTFAIKTRTFTVTSTSAVTNSAGAAATLADVAVGTKVTGSYEKSADGTMSVDTLKISQ